MFFTGWGTDEATIINILAHRNARQRTTIRQVYAETYGEELLKSLEKELSSDFEVGFYISYPLLPWFLLLQKLYSKDGKSGQHVDTLC